jgi:hypothetical protein
MPRLHFSNKKTETNYPELDLLIQRSNLVLDTEVAMQY